MLTLTAIFATLAAVVAYAYAGYPVLIRVASRLFGREPAAPHVADADLPRVTMIVSAYNERAVIVDRLHNAVAMDYPAGKLDVVVASDGSDDGTADAVRQFGHPRVSVLDYRERRGKAATLNAAVADTHGDVLMLTDANTAIDPQAARRLARWFADPRVGVACGRLILTDPATGKNADGLYWKYETFLKNCEATLGALLGANGAIYAVRRDCYRPVPAGTIVDDFVIPLLAKRHTGCGIVYDADATAGEETAADLAGEFRRRARIGAGGFQAIALLWPLMNPRWGWLAFAFVSHKVLRWLCPFALVGMLLVSAIAAATGSATFTILLAAQLAFYGLSAVVHRLPAGIERLRPLRLATMFTGMNAALAVGFWRWALGTQSGAWDRTVRSAENAFDGPCLAPSPGTPGEG